MQKPSISRILDVNVNRAKEGLRVIEEVSRFILVNSKITNNLRNLRTSINNISKENNYILERNIEKDFGSKFTPKDRKDLFDIVKANSKRVEEALRVLEEFSEEKKLFNEFRFKAYNCEKLILLELERQGFNKYQNIDLSVYVVNDDVKILMDAVKAGAGLIQLRDKISSAGVIVKKAKKMKIFLDNIPQNKKPIFIINDRADIAYLADADGLHLGQDDISIKEARKILGFGKIVGKTTHNLKQGLKAQKEGANYISVGPVYATPTKPERQPVGLEYVKTAGETVKIPWVAIGGINKETIDKVIKSGARNIALVRAYNDISYIKKRLNKYYKRDKP